MGNGLIFQWLRLVHIRWVLPFLGILTVLALLYLFVNPYGNYLSIPTYTNEGSTSISNDVKKFSHSSKLAGSDSIHDHNNHLDDASSSHDTRQADSNFEVGEQNLYRGPMFQREGNVGSQISAETGLNRSAMDLYTGKECTSLAFEGRQGIPEANFASNDIQEASGCNREVVVAKRIEYVHTDQKLSSGKSVLSMPSSLEYSNKHKLKDSGLTDGVPTVITVMVGNTSSSKRQGKAMSIGQMNFMLLENHNGMKLKRPRSSSQLDRKLQAVKFLIENAPIQRNISGVHSSIFRNYSMFKRSYELMETTLKVYVYKEGDKPIFHMPYMRGIYASEGWFMKLMERSKQFVVKDPKKAHLFYLPFSSVKLRNALNGSSFITQKDLENHLRSYVDRIAAKYRFWNRKGGADHFLVACHDWAPRLTRNVFGSSIRVLCNSNIARGFQIGKDVSLPVTYIRSAENPSRDIGGNPPSNRPILAFFAGGMHGYVRPLLLQHWHNKAPDMKILGPMPRDIEGKAKYREFMKSSKYCICAKGYEVHTPRVVESIYYECLPVIISDNYVPPFFELLNWESFAVFVLEDDIPRLREILVSIPEDRYSMMLHRLKMVRRYFIWHKVPERYDLFYMILHSVWYNMVFRVSG